MTEDQQSNVSSKERKTSIHDIRNQDFVSRLLAATPPYLYSAPVGPNNFFFSDMLRSLVQAKNNENARNLQLQQAALARRPRKRSWSQHRPYYEHLKERKEMEEKMQQAAAGLIEKPLELTNKQIFPIASKYSKQLESLKENSIQVSTKIPNTSSAAISNQNDQKVQDFETNTHNQSQTKNHQQQQQQQQQQHQQQQQQSSNYECTSTSSSSNPPISDPPTPSLQPSDLALPPPPPVWYPSLYPPYGIDPLHFFIDLRVSGHIYDRKKENGSPLSTENINSGQNDNSTTADAIVSKHRHGSAFTVPTPRNEKNSSAINLSAAGSSTSESSGSAGGMTATSDRHDPYNKIYDLSETKENHFSTFKNANYVLQNLPKLYSQFANRDPEFLERSSLNDNKSEEQDVDDDYIDEQKENSGHIDVELIGDRCQSPDDDDDVIHQID